MFNCVHFVSRLIRVFSFAPLDIDINSKRFLKTNAVEVGLQGNEYETNISTRWFLRRV